MSVLLSHLASYGFTVIASTLPNTGSGNEIDAAAHYLVAQNGVAARAAVEPRLAGQRRQVSTALRQDAGLP